MRMRCGGGSARGSARPWRCCARSVRCCASARSASPPGPARPPEGWTWLRTGERGAGRGRARGDRWGPGGCERAALCVPQGAGARHVLPRLRALPGERLPLRRAAAAHLRRARHVGQVGAAGAGSGGAAGRASAPRFSSALPRSFSLTLIDALDTLLVSTGRPTAVYPCEKSIYPLSRGCAPALPCCRSADPGQRHRVPAGGGRAAGRAGFRYRCQRVRLRNEYPR